MNNLGDTWAGIIKGAAAIGGFVLGWFGGWDISLRVLIALMAADLVSGFVVGWMRKSHKTESGGLDSRVGFSGIGKKLLILVVVIAATQVDLLFGTESALRNMACWFYAANEGLSVTENLALAGVPFPQKLKDALEQMKDKK